jgi:hypothetical protein
MPVGISPGGRPIDESPLSTSKTSNWVARNGGLPPYVRGIARGIAKRHGGKVTSRDIAAAWEYVKRLSLTSKNPKVKAAAAKAVAQEGALRARAHSHDLSHSMDSDTDEKGGTKMAKLSPKAKKALAKKMFKKNAKNMNFSNAAEYSSSLGQEIDLTYVGFNALKAKLAAKGATNPGALAAAIGRKKYGKAKFQKAAARGAKLGKKK